MDRDIRKESESAWQNRPGNHIQEKMVESTQQLVIENIRQILGLDEASGSSHFFIEGGDSLLAAQLLLKLNRSWPDMSPALSLADLMEYPTAGELSLLVRTRLESAQPDVA